VVVLASALYILRRAASRRARALSAAAG
jgi:hypothetical protein